MEFGDVMIVMGVIFLLAFLVETLVEFLFAPIFNNVGQLEKLKWTQFYIAVVVGVIGAFVYQFDLLFLLSGFLAQLFSPLVQADPAIPQTVYGTAITGVAIGHGAAFLHDAVTRYFKKPEIPGTGI
jgi:hypothetical protein